VGASGGSSGRVRCPPAPTRSPPLPPEQVYTAAGWVASGPDELAAALLPAGRAAALSSDAGSGIFVGWSSGSSEDDEGSDGEDSQAARSIQQQLNTSPLWVLGMFTPAAPVPVSGAAPPASGSHAGAPENEHAAVPRSLTEIYKLSNQNKRRGAAVRRPSEEVQPELEEGKALEEDGESSSDGAQEELGDEEDGGEEDEEDGDGTKRRRPVGENAEAWGGEASAEATEEFMRRIGWLRPDAEMPTGSDVAVDAQRGVGGASAPRRGGCDSSTGSEVGFGGNLLPAADLRDPPQLPFQRQLPPHMPSPMRPAAPSHQHAPGGGFVQQLLGAQSPMPPAGPMAQEVDGGKRPSSRPRHKKRAGGEFEYSGQTESTQFVFGAPQSGAPQQRGPSHGGGPHGGGGGGSHGGRGSAAGSAGGNKRSVFGAPGAQKGGAGRRY